MIFKEQTLIVLGAGASLEYNYPTSSELIENICIRTLPLENKIVGSNLYTPYFLDEPDQDDEGNFNYFYTELRHLNFNSVQMQRFSSFLSKSSAPSIDEFLAVKDIKDEFSWLGKCALIQSILYCENKNDRFKGWYEKFFRLFWPDPGEDFDFSNVSILTFNYDRSLEQAIFNKLMIYYLNDVKKAISVFKSLKIHHVYGSIADVVESENHVIKDPMRFKYGEFPNFIEMKNSSYMHAMWKNLNSRIRTFHEIEAEQSDIIQNMIRNSKVIVFLGFGFHKRNLTYFQEFASGHLRATSIGLNYRQNKNAKECFGGRIKFFPNKISEFLDLDFDLPSIWGD